MAIPQPRLVSVPAPFTQGGLWCGATGETILDKSRSVRWIVVCRRLDSATHLFLPLGAEMQTSLAAQKEMLPGSLLNRGVLRFDLRYSCAWSLYCAMTGPVSIIHLGNHFQIAYNGKLLRASLLAFSALNAGIGTRHSCGYYFIPFFGINLPPVSLPLVIQGEVFRDRYSHWACFLTIGAPCTGNRNSASNNLRSFFKDNRLLLR